MALIPNRELVLIGAGLGLVAIVGGYFVAKKAGSVVSGAAGAVNSGADSVARTLSGDPYDTVGTALWKFFNPGAVAAERSLLGGPRAEFLESVPSRDELAARGLFNYPMVVFP